MHLEQQRVQRNLYLRVVGMWQGVWREAGSSHTMYSSEEEGVGGPPAQAWGEREQRNRQWIASLAEGNSVNIAPPPFPVRRNPDTSFTSYEGGERDKRPTQYCLDLVKRG